MIQDLTLCHLVAKFPDRSFPVSNGSNSLVAVREKLLSAELRQLDRVYDDQFRIVVLGVKTEGKHIKMTAWKTAVAVHFHQLETPKNQAIQLPNKMVH